MQGFLELCCEFAFDPVKDLFEEIQNITKIIYINKDRIINDMQVFHKEEISFKDFDHVLTAGDYKLTN